jgi:hypothetical protein
MKMLTFSRFFPPNEWEGWKGWFYYAKDVVIEIPLVLKYSWQRARRGWADCDAWNVDGWFCAVVPNILRQLARNKQGVPIEFEKNPEAWFNVLEQMAIDLEAGDRFNEKWFGEEGLYNTGTQGECCDEEDEACSRIKTGLSSFYEYFFSLWD